MLPLISSFSLLFQLKKKTEVSIRENRNATVRDFVFLSVPYKFSFLTLEKYLHYNIRTLTVLTKRHLQHHAHVHAVLIHLVSCLALIKGSGRHINSG